MPRFGFQYVLLSKDCMLSLQASSNNSSSWLLPPCPFCCHNPSPSSKKRIPEFLVNRGVKGTQPLEISLLELFFNLVFQLPSPDDFKTLCKESSPSSLPKICKGNWSDCCHTGLTWNDRVRFYSKAFFHAAKYF